MNQELRELPSSPSTLFAISSRQSSSSGVQIIVLVICSTWIGNGLVLEYYCWDTANTLKQLNKNGEHKRKQWQGE